MEAKIRRLLERLEELERILGQPETVLDRPLFRKLSQEHAYLRELKEAFLFYKKAQEELDQSKALLLTEKDPEMIAIIKEEISSLQQKIDLAKKKVETLLVPPDPRDSRNIILELRAGTGGDEAALFVGDSLRMYKAYADRKGWKTETISSSLSELGGFKEYIMALSGPNVFRYMQYEGGTHRVQRVPKTETQGRVHTSAITVAVLIEPEEQDVEIDERDLQIDTYRSSGAGGQHVNVTDSAVSITHKPSGIVVACQDERSQHKNKDKAMRLLKAKLAEEMARAQKEEQSALRSKQVGTGDRSEKIRTYNFPQNRLTDHRIDLTLYKLDQVMDGDLDDITEALVAFFYQQKLLSE